MNLSRRGTEGVMARTGGGTRADGRATAEQVVIAAERLFAERGVEAVSLREVAKAATSRDLLVQLVVGALAARGNAEATGEPGLSSRAGFTEDLLEAAVGLMLAPAGPDNGDPRRPAPRIRS